MRKIVYILIGLCLGAAGCLNDKTTGAHIGISDLSTSRAETDTLLFSTTIAPIILDSKEFISQTDPDCPLEYEWSAGEITGWNNHDKFYQVDSMNVISHESKLEYIFPTIGKHLLRLKVTNPYSAQILYWAVNVSLGFDQGIILFSKNDESKGMFSILNSPKGIDSLLAMTPGHFSFVTGHDDPKLDEDIVDFIVYSGNGGYPDFGAQFLHILSAKNKEAYPVDQYSLQTIPGAAYKFSKTPLNLTMHWHSMNARTQYDLFAFTEDGDVLSYCQTFQQEFSPMAFSDIPHWDRTSISYSRMSSDSKQYGDIRWLYDDETSTIYGMSHHCMQSNTDPNKKVNDVIGPESFPDEEVIIASYGPCRWGSGAPLQNYVTVYTRSKENPQHIYMHIWLDVMWGSNFIKNESESYLVELPQGEDIAITKDTRILPLPETRQRFFHNGEKVFTMGEKTTPPLASAPSGRDVFDLANINPNAEITDINLVIPKNGNKYYVLVAAYDPTSAEEKKGSIYVLAADDLSNVLAKYENIAYKPLRIFYKYHDL